MTSGMLTSKVCANGKAMGMVMAITPQLDPVVNDSSDTVINTTTGNN